MRGRVSALVIGLTFFIFLKNAKAYPQFISHGYHSCLTCHYNPFGNGPLNDYGRALGATLVADRTFAHSKTTEEEIAQNSGFMYMKAFNKHVRPSLDYRGMYLERSAGTNVEDEEWIHMQGNVNLVVKGGENDKYVASATVGYAPSPRSNEDLDEPNYRSREHYFGWRPTPKWGIYAGLMDKVFGIRVPDHNSFARTTTGLGQNDQAHGLTVHYVGEKFEIGFNPFIGNLGNDAETRQVGFSGMYEHSVTKDSRLGVSVLSSKSDFTEKSIGALHLRTAFGKGSSLMYELGQLTMNRLLFNRETETRYMFLQNHIRLKRGLYIYTTIEYLREDLSETDETYRLGPGIQYFPYRGLEFRADIYNSRVVSDSLASEDDWDLTGQIHLWF